MKTIITLASSLAIVAIVSATPVLADEYHHHHHHNRYVSYRAPQFANWDQRRSYYSNNWRRVSLAQQRAMDAEMRAHWDAYHHNNWNGAYGWSNYNDPGFLNYLHNNNPNLFTRIGTYIGL